MYHDVISAASIITIRNSIKSLLPTTFDHPFLTLRPEVLSVGDFIELTVQIEAVK